MLTAAWMIPLITSKPEQLLPVPQPDRSAATASNEQPASKFVAGSTSVLGSRAPNVYVSDDQGNLLALERADYFFARTGSLPVQGYRDSQIAVIIDGQRAWLEVGNLIFSNSIGISLQQQLLYAYFAKRHSMQSMQLLNNPSSPQANDVTAEFGLGWSRYFGSEVGSVQNESTTTGAAPENGSQDPSSGSASIADVPFLPWPPPRANYVKDISAVAPPSGTIGGVASQLSARLYLKGYDRVQFFSVPGGFAIATAVERFDSNGRPAAHRWSHAKVTEFESFSDYIRRLIGGETGSLRLFVFIVTNADMSTNPFRPTESEVDSWQALGRPELSRSLATRRIAPGSKTWLLVYEFHPTADGRQRLLASEQPTLPLAAHLSALGLK